MKRASLLVAATAVLGPLVLSSSASATFDHPAKSNKIQVLMVTAYNQCTAPTLTHRPSLSLPACAPSASTANDTTNVMTFGPKGFVQIKLGVTAGDVKIKAKGKDVLNNGSPYNGNVNATWQIRWTDNGCTPPNYDVDCTSVDIPWPVAVTCAAGACSASTTMNAINSGVVHAGDQSNVEVGRPIVQDPDGDDFARQGLYVK